MSKVCVEIEIDTETGELTVAECDLKEEEMAVEEGMEPSGQVFQSMDEALQAAAELLTGDTRQTPEEVKKSVMTGYKRAGNIPTAGEMQ